MSMGDGVTGSIPVATGRNEGSGETKRMDVGVRRNHKRGGQHYGQMQPGLRTHIFVASRG